MAEAPANYIPADSDIPLGIHQNSWGSVKTSTLGIFHSPCGVFHCCPVHFSFLALGIFHFPWGVFYSLPLHFSFLPSTCFIPCPAHFSFPLGVFHSCLPHFFIPGLGQFLIPLGGISFLTLGFPHSCPPHFSFIPWAFFIALGGVFDSLFWFFTFPPWGLFIALC
jgi:hypothetical protein